MTTQKKAIGAVLMLYKLVLTFTSVHKSFSITIHIKDIEQYSPVVHFTYDYLSYYSIVEISAQIRKELESLFFIFVPQEEKMIQFV